MASAAAVDVVRSNWTPFTAVVRSDAPPHEAAATASAVAATIPSLRMTPPCQTISTGVPTVIMPTR